MIEQVLFSPLDTRYARDLPESLSEHASIRAQILVERDWLLCLMEEGLCPKIDARALDETFAGVYMDEITEVEKRTQHATRALVEVLAHRLREKFEGTPQESAADWVHVGLTSFDVVDTAQRVRVRDFMMKDCLPAMAELKKVLRRWARNHAQTPQVGRTHGQWAVPTFFGLQFAEAHARLDEIETRLHISLDDLRGQASGAIGGYHASSLLVKDPLALERKLLDKLKLRPHLGSTQILPPEDLMALAQDLFNASSVIAKIATDMRHLARSEIAEIAEGLKEGQVGSSTMPQKRNPWNFEHVCSLYKVLLSRLNLMQMDMVSEHHRDLTNSASGRFYTEHFAVTYLMVRRLTRVLERMECFPNNMKRHMDEAGATVLAEALYVTLTKNGVGHAHDKVREAARECEKTGKSLWEVVSSKDYFPKGLTLPQLLENALQGSRKKMQALMSDWKD
jgi:adenylosuccinate lyase